MYLIPSSADSGAWKKMGFDAQVIQARQHNQASASIPASATPSCVPFVWQLSTTYTYLVVKTFMHAHFI
jgi:hypothetical protein